jgi:hypothetical protein
MPSFIAVWRFLTTMLSDPFNAYLGARLGLFADSNLLDGMPKVDGFYPLYVKEEFETRNALYYSTNAPSTNLATIELETALYLTTNNFPSALADFLGVCQITATGNLLEWEARPTYMPLVTAGQRPIFVEPTNSLRALLPPAFEPRQAVYLPVDAQPFVSVSNQTKARIVSRRFSAHRVVFEVEAQQPSMVVAAQTYYPCWKAYVDGQPTRLWRANHAFQALQAPSGRHSVQLVYRDMRFLAGVAISGMTMIGCMIGLVRGRKGTARLIP